MTRIQNYINGQLVAPGNGQYFDNINPATGQVHGQVPDSDERDIEAAVAAAKKAFPAWSQMPTAKRAAYLTKVADIIKSKLEAFAKAEADDNGKPLWLAQSVDIPRAISNLKFFATAIQHEAGKAYQTNEEAINYTYDKAVGVVACISPWNLPIYLFTWKIAPALAAGCTVVAKPSEVTPLTAFMLSEACIAAGLPEGVLNIVHGMGPKTGGVMTAHPDVKAISFTGGTGTGAKIAAIAAPKFKKLSLELGGKNPNIIFDDCDFKDALYTTLKSSFANQGQICLCGSRIFIQKGIYERFKTALVEKAQKIKVGDPLDESTKCGAVVSKGHFEKILSYIELAKEEGGKVLCGGEAVKVSGRCENGYFIQPTIIENLDEHCRTNQEEIFGPVVTLMPFETEEEVITKANATPYGLSATIWTENLKKAHRVAHAVESGIIWVNCWLLRDLRTPFGGMKESGVGREGGFHALNFFKETKNVCIKL